VPGSRDQVPCDRVDRLRARPGTDRGESGLLRLAHDLVDLAGPLARLAGGEGAGAVGAVAVELRPHVEDDQLARTDLAIARLGVRQRAVRAGSDDRREGRLRPQLPHPRLGGGRNLELAATGEAVLQRPAPDVVGELGGGRDRGELRLVLDPAQLLHGPPRALQGNAVGQLLLEPFQGADRHLVVLEAGPARQVPGYPTEPVVGDGDYLPALDLRLGALGVAEVGEEDADALAADTGPVGATEAGQVADVDEVGDEEAVELARGRQGLEPVAASPHQAGSAPSLAASSSSASR
jgi:hypothetical protein